MQKKIFPLLALVAAALFYYWVKNNQRGETTNVKNNDNITIDAFPFSRDTSNLIYSKHARCRMGCRQIDDFEVKEILLTGKLDESRIQESNQGVTYPLEGLTRDKQYVRVVFAPKKKETVVVTVIDLETEWPCDCK